MFWFYEEEGGVEVFNYQISVNPVNSPKTNHSEVSFGAKKIPTDVSKFLKTNLLKAKNADIFVHVSPETDPDAANTAITLANKLRENGVNAIVHSGNNKIDDLVFNKLNKISNIHQKGPDVSILVDVNEIKRISDNPKGKLFVFDHHIDTGSIKNAYKYIDESARSCSGMLFNLFKSWHLKISKTDAQNLLYGTCDDFIKSKYLKVENSKITELPALKKDGNSQKVLNGIKKHLSKSEQKKVYKRLDVLSNLTLEEKIFQKRIFSEVKTTKNGKLAYLIIDPQDKEWLSLGLDNTRTSTILRDLRMRLINGIKDDKAFTIGQREQLKNVKGAAVFYSVANKPTIYQMSIHSKDDFAEKLITYIKKNINANLEAGGHPNRAGGRVYSNNKTDINNFIDSFFTAAQNVN